MLRKIAFAGVGLIMLVSPALASAQSTDVQSQIAALQALIKQLLVQIAQLQGSTSEQSNCVDLSSSLTLGSNGDDVMRLQKYLIRSGVLDAQYNTGYYGFITAQAVGKVQMNLNIVNSANDPAFGIVGPRTRAVLACHGTTRPVESPISGPSASIDQSSLTASTGGKDAGVATITGAASNVSQVVVALKGGNSATTNVMNGRWSAAVSQVYPGTYSVEVLDNDYGSQHNNVLAMGMLTVTSPNQNPPQSGAALTIGSVIGAQVTVNYTNLPVHAYITLLWKNENGQWEGGVQAQVPYGGSGSVVISENVNAPSGYYIARAQTSDTMNWSVDSQQFVYGSTNTALNCSLSASPSTVVSGQSVVLSWNSLGASHAQWKQDSAANLLGLPYGNIVADGSLTFTVSGKSGVISPVLNVSRDNGLLGTCTTNITVLPGPTQTNPVVINSFTASATYVTPGQPMTFTWSSNLTADDIQKYGGGCSINGLSTNNQQIYVNNGGNGSGATNYNPGITATYTLMCTSGGKDGSPMATKQVTVVVSYAAALQQCPANSATQRAQVGQTIACTCAPGFAMGSIWGGYSYYTDNSDICTAGAQSGQISQTYGGEVDYTIMPGQNSYPAWSYNGITSQAWTEYWPGSFQITGPKG